MKPTWKDEQFGVELYLADCLEVLPHLPTADSVVTDPPYCSGGFSETAKKAAKGMGLRSETIRDVGWFAGDNMTTGGISWLMRAVARHCYSIMPEGATMTVFTDWRMVGHLAPAMESARFRYQNLVVWNKGSAGLGAGFRAQHELAMHFAKGTGKYFDASFGNVITTGRVAAQGRAHQTQKPIELMEAIVRVTSPDTGLVVDPFMGSGSTGVAALQQGRQFVGVEVDPRYFEIAVKRIQDAIVKKQGGPLLATHKPEQLRLGQEARR